MANTDSYEDNIEDSHRFGVNNSDKTFLNRLYIHRVNKRTYRDIDNKHNKFLKNLSKSSSH